MSRWIILVDIFSNLEENLQIVLKSYKDDSCHRMVHATVFTLQNYDLRVYRSDAMKSLSGCMYQFAGILTFA